MKTMKATALLVLLLSTGAYANESGPAKAAEELLDSLNFERAMTDIINQMVEGDMQRNPEMGPYRKIIRDFYQKYVGYESIKGDMIRIYSAEFTEDELLELKKFYSTPLGKKTIEKMPTLMQQGAEMGVAKVRDHIPELKGAIEAESLRIQMMQLH